MPERGVRFANIFNFRDLGGYRTDNGDAVRWRRLFRSDDLSRLQPADTSRFAGLGIRTVVDLRRPAEIDADGRIPAIDGVTYRHIYLPHPAWPSRDFTDTAERTAYVVERYREMAEASAAEFGAALRLIADAGAAPLVFHCVAGKDRTGILAALTLSLLGVRDDDVVDDYHLSESVEPAAWDYYRRGRPDLRAVRPYEISPRDAMVGFLRDLRARHGSVTAYAESIGMSEQHRDAMRAHLVEPATTPLADPTLAADPHPAAASVLPAAARHSRTVATQP